MGTSLGTDTVLAGRYRLGPLLGVGGMAEVYDAIDDRLGRPVAVKVLKPMMAARPDVRRRFEAEARAAARLSHPNIVSVYDTGIDDGVPWLVMERLPGETLADRLERDGRLDVQWVQRMAGDVLGALAAAHAGGLVHRDIKPGNILIDPNGCAKVADFGIAKSLDVTDDHTATGQLVGTPAYLAPERIDGDPATVQSDIYALGVVLYEALSGRKPFDGTTPLTIAYAVQHGNAAPLDSMRSDVPRPMVDAIARAMARDPSVRFTSAADMANALSVTPSTVTRDATMVLPAAARDGRDDVSVVWNLAHSARFPTTKRVWAMVAAAALVVLVIVVAFAFVGNRPSSADVLARDLRRAADGLSAPADGPKAGDTAIALRTLANDVDGAASEASNASAHGDALLADLANWRALGQLDPSTTDSLRRLVERVPGTHDSAFVATTTTTSPAVSEEGQQGPGGSHGHGKKHRENNND